MVFKISDAIALKTPLRFDFSNLGSEHTERDLKRLRERNESSVKAMEREKAIYDLLAESPHPNITQSILCGPEGIFLERMETSLLARMAQPHPIDLRLKFCWVKELTSAAAWLEKLGIVHGDLRPPNLLLCHCEHLKLVHFDNAVKIGESLEAFTDPFWINKKTEALTVLGL